MHCVKLVLALVVAALVAMPEPAAAQSCTIPDYAAEADSRLTGECDEIERFTIATPSGSRRVRIIGDSAMPDGFTEPYPLVRQGIERAAAALRTIGTGQVDNLVVLVSGLLPDSDDPDGPTSVHGVAHAVYVDECLMIVYPGNAGSRELGFATAHEFFHCVQYATASDQMDAFLAGQPSDWWVEGTAEWFANLAYRGTGNSDERVRSFDETSPDMALTSLSDSDGAVVFFFWYGENHGYPAIVSLMPTMATSAGEARERSALASLLPPDGFQALAQDYLDREIRQPGSRAIPSAPEDGASIIWVDDNQVEEIEADQLVLHRAELIFTCGTWTVQLSDEEGEWAVSQEPGEWSRLPARIEVPAGEDKRFRLGAMGPGEDGFHVTIAATRADEEGRCRCKKPTEAEAARLDQCLVGRWELVSGGGNEWLDQQLNMIEQSSGTWDSYESNTTAGNRMLTVSRDGLYEYRNASATRTVHATKKDDVFESRIEGVSAGIGTWTARSDLLVTCAISETSGATAELNLDGSIMRMDLPGYLTEHLYSGGYTYVCSDTQLTLRFRDMGTLPEPMVWQYERR